MTNMVHTTKVMIVEDEAIIAQDIKMRLNEFGFTVIGMARSAAEAFTQIERELPDVVLMDIQIQGNLDGIAAGDVVRTRYALPVIYLTAHADDATLHRAKQTDPYGYIVKPIENNNMKAVITMALNKHMLERERSNVRQMPSTILQGLPDAVLLANTAGEILFLNKAAEHLTGWSSGEAVGKGVLEVARIEDAGGCPISIDLMQEATTKAASVRVPSSSALITKQRGAIEVAGCIASAGNGNELTSGVLITLRDISAQLDEELRARQERQMLLTGELARGVGREFYALLNLVEDCVSEIGEHCCTDPVDYIQQAGQIGRQMSVQLMDLGEDYGSALAIDVSQCLFGSRQFFESICGAGLRVAITAPLHVGYVLSTGNHFVRTLLNLCLNAKAFLNGMGKITITANVHNEAVGSSRSRSFIRLAFLAEPPVGINDSSPEDYDALFGANVSGLSLMIVRAITTSAGGFCRTSETAGASIVEVFLPSHQSSDTAAAARDEFSRVPACAAGA
jgi:two-component system cell cycle sensor histidine kinase/response regulator CckA